MPFRNSVIAAVIATALTGRRIIIDAFASIGGAVILFFYGEPYTHDVETDDNVARIQVDEAGVERFLKLRGPVPEPASPFDPSINTPSELRLSAYYSGVKSATLLTGDEVTVECGAADGVTVLRASGLGSIVYIQGDDIRIGTLTNSYNIMAPTDCSAGVTIWQGANTASLTNVDAWYLRIGRMVHYWGTAEPTGSPGGAGRLELSLPIPMELPLGDIIQLGIAQFNDDSSSQYDMMMAQQVDTGDDDRTRFWDAGPAGSRNIAMASGDRLSWNLTYPAGS